MSREGFVKIWKEYINELAVCLVEAERNPKSPASEKLQRLTNEACILVRIPVLSLLFQFVPVASLHVNSRSMQVMRVAISNPIGIKRWAASKMEDTVILPGERNIKACRTVLPTFFALACTQAHNK